MNSIFKNVYYEINNCHCQLFRGLFIVICFSGFGNSIVFVNEGVPIVRFTCALVNLIAWYGNNYLCWLSCVCVSFVCVNVLWNTITASICISDKNKFWFDPFLILNPDDDVAVKCSAMEISLYVLLFGNAYSCSLKQIICSYNSYNDQKINSITCVDLYSNVGEQPNFS